MCARRAARAGSRSSSRAVGDPVAVRREPRVVGEGGQPERAAQPRPLALAARRDRDLAVGGRERLVRDDVRMGVAEPARRRPADERVLGLVDEDGEGRGEQRDVDSLAGRGSAASRAASAARTATAPWSPAMTSAIATPTFVGPPPSSSAAPVIDISPRHGLDDEVVARPVGVGAGRAVARDREMDEARVDRAPARRRRSPVGRSRRSGSSRRARRRRRAAGAGPAAPSGCLRSSRMLRLLRLTAR